MEMRSNRVRRKLDAGEPAFVCSGFTHADDIDAFGPKGFDGIWLEGEHGSVDAADLGNLTRACDIWGMTSVVRVNKNDQALIYRTLDRGAQAVIVPHVDTAVEAQNVVNGGKFAPLGNRGLFTSRQGLHGESPEGHWLARGGVADHTPRPSACMFAILKHHDVFSCSSTGFCGTT